jgi:ABC-type multidrug transport system fused ATPase/permease subunit
VGRTSNTAWLLHIAKPQRSRIILGCLIVIIGSAFGVCDPLLMKKLIDVALPQHNRSLSALLVATIALVLLLRAPVGAIGALFTYDAACICAVNIRTLLLSKMLDLSLDYHESSSPGEKLSRFEDDITRIAEVTSDIASAGCRALALFVVNCVAILAISPGTASLLLVALPAFALVRHLFRGKIQKGTEELQHAIGHSAGFLCEILSAIPQIQLLGAKTALTSRITAQWAERRNAQHRLKRAEMDFGASTGGVTTCALMAMLLLGSIRVLNGTLSIGGLVAVYTFTTRLFDPIGAVMELYSRLQRVRTSIERIREILDMRPTVQDRCGPTYYCNVSRPDILIEGVGYTYSETLAALHDVDLHILPGERIVIAGKSGSGKTTLGRLLVRLLDPQHGHILLADRPLYDYSLDQLRELVCYVPQHPIVFSGTIRDNVLCGSPQVSQKELEEVIDCVQLSGLLSRFKEGIDKPLGPGGTGLSGGEMQRVVLARSLLRKPPILILDESTSALDVSTEQLVLAAMLRFRADMTLIMISHRLTSLTWAERVVVLDSGRIVSDKRHSNSRSTIPSLVLPSGQPFTSTEMCVENGR